MNCQWASMSATYMCIRNLELVISIEEDPGQSRFPADLDCQCPLSPLQAQPGTQAKPRLADITSSFTDISKTLLAAKLAGFWP